MKKIFTFICIFAVLACGTLAGCGGKPGEEQEENNKPTVEFTDYDLVKAGASSYTIVVPETSSAGETMAQNDLRTYFREATGVDLPIVTDKEVTWSEGAEYLSVGNTALLEDAGVTVDRDKIGVNGYRVETKGRSVFMAGGKEYGTLYAVYEFLRGTFHFEVYALDEIVHDTGVTDCKVPDYHTEVIPDIQQLQSQYGALINDASGALRLGYQTWAELWMFGAIPSSSKNIGFVHNTLSYVAIDDWAEEHPTWFSPDRTQLCLSNEEMYETAFLPALKEMILSKPDVLNVSVTQMDVRTWCTCEQCSADKAKYGTDAGNLVNFGNKCARDIKEWLAEVAPGRKVNIVIFAYHNSEGAPAKLNDAGEYVPIEESLKFEDNLVLFWCPSLANWKEPLYEGANANYLNSMKAWSTMAHTVYVWGYETNFHEYLLNFNTVDTLQQNMKFYRDFNVQLLFNQGEHNQAVGTDFTDLSIYLTAKLRWDVDADYDALIRDFFANYYKEAGDTMLRLFNHLRVWENYMEDSLGYNGNKFNSSLNQKYWPKNVLDGFLAEIDRAYADIEPLKISDPEKYEKLYWRINRESITFRYALINLYAGNYTQSELLRMKTEFRADAESIGINYYKEVGPIGNLWSQWGIA